MQEARWIVEDRRAKLQRAMAMPGLSHGQRETIRRVERILVLEDRKLTTRRNFVTQATALGRFLGKPFERATRGDLEAYLTLVAGRSDGSLGAAKQFLKAFYKRLLQPDAPGHPKLVSWIRLKGGCTIQKLPRDLVSVEEVKRLAASCYHPRDRAIIAALHESAARASEFVGMHVGDVAWDEYGARATVNGKTGPRTIRLINAIPDLRNWLDVHPRRGDPEAPLWVSFSRRAHLGPLHADGLRDLVKRIAGQAGIKKRVHPHLFRHSRITELAKYLSESELKVFAGWTPGSMMARVYIHLSGDHVEEKMLRHAGLIKQDRSARENPLDAQVCPNCQHPNSPAAAYCARCTLPISDEEMAEKRKMLEVMPEFMELLRDPGVRDFLKERAWQKQREASSRAAPSRASWA